MSWTCVLFTTASKPIRRSPRSSCRLSPGRRPSTCRSHGRLVAGRALAFAERHAAKFAAPHDERGVQQSALLEVG